MISFAPLIHENLSSDIQYSVDDVFTVSKLHALELAGHDISRVKYHWKESVFDNVIWNVEPTESIQSMVDRHVKNIREIYDYIALWFSGGYDSFTILKAFIRNGLKIDELLLQHRDWHVGVNYLDYKTALDSAIMVKKLWLPDVKITTVNWGNKNAVIDFYKDDGLDWIYNSGGLSRISQNSRAMLYEKNPNIKKSLDRPGRNIQINGHDKPRVNLRDGHWYSARPDSMFYQESQEWCLQFWFLPDLYVKQTWMMINWLETLNQTNHDFVHVLQSHAIDDDLYMKWNLAMGRDIPLFPFSRGRGHKQSFSNGIDSPEALPLLKSIESSHQEIYRRYKLGADHLSQIDQQIRDSGNHNVLLSKHYFIKSFTKHTKEI